MPTVKQDLEAVAAGLEGGLKGLVSRLIEGTIDDLDGPIRETSMRLAVAAKRGRQDLVDASKDQLSLLMMENEHRLRAEAGGFMDFALTAGIQLLFDGAVAGLAGLKVAP